jgi:hypothetical protein
VDEHPVAATTPAHVVVPLANTPEGPVVVPVATATVAPDVVPVDARTLAPVAVPTAAVMAMRVSASFTFEGVDFDALDSLAQDGIRQSVATSIAQEINGVQTSDVDVRLSAGSVAVVAIISGANLDGISTEVMSESKALTSAIVKSVSAIPGLPTTGSITISGLQANVVEEPDVVAAADDTPMPTASPTTVPSTVDASDTDAPTSAPTSAPTLAPTNVPTLSSPDLAPTDTDEDTAGGVSILVPSPTPTRVPSPPGATLLPTLAPEPVFETVVQEAEVTPAPTNVVRTSEGSCDGRHVTVTTIIVIMCTVQSFY